MRDGVNVSRILFQLIIARSL